MNTIKPTYDIALAAGWDAGNRHARAAGRDHWDGSDYAESVRVFNEVMNGEE